MGIKGLRKLLEDKAPKSMKERRLRNYFHRRIAVDANICIYQFLTAIGENNLLKNKNGEDTRHLSGMFYRTLNFVEAGIEPIYVFDGTPPDMKKPELAKRNERRKDAKKQLDLTGAVEDGDKEKVKDAEELRKRTVKVSRKQYDDCKLLLQLMGVPVIQAPSEAEAQCSQLCKDRQVYAVASEDSDCLTFGAPRVLMNFKGSDQERVTEFDCAKIFVELKLTMDQFIDLCILCGCDYCGSIKGIEGQKALNLIHQHGSIESILDNNDSYQCPDNWLYKEARHLFKEPNVILHVPEKQLQWTKHDAEGLIKFLVKDNDFSLTRVTGSFSRMKHGRSLPYDRMEDFLKLKRKEASEEDTEAASKKTKA